MKKAELLKEVSAIRSDIKDILQLVETIASSDCKSVLAIGEAMVARPHLKEAIQVLDKIVSNGKTMNEGEIYNHLQLSLNFAYQAVVETACINGIIHNQIKQVYEKIFSLLPSKHFQPTIV